MESLQIFTFGGLRVILGEVPIPGFETRKAEALLLYLACNRRSFPREVLAEMLWDERSQQQALSNLRVVLAKLRKPLDPYLTIQRDTIAVNPQASIWLDADEFEAHLKAAHPAGEAPSDAAPKIEQAIALYQGEFLEGFYLRESRGFEAWLVQERERLHRLAIGALHDLVAYELAAGTYAAGLAHATRLLGLDTLNEFAHRQMMQLLYLSGQRSEALAQYETCRRLLWEEFGVEPAAETKQLIEQIRAGELRPPPLKDNSVQKSLIPVANPYKGLCAFQQSDAADFFGRETLTERLVARLGEVGEASRFLAVVGPSGSGKSSLVKAGLIPAIRRGALPGSEKWLVVELVPGNHPFDEVEIALRRNAASEMAGMEGPLPRDGQSILRAARLALPSDETELLLVIDQFEEVFTLGEDIDEARQFLQCLVVAVTAPRSPLRVVITLRADFYDRPLLHMDFGKLLQDRTEVVLPLRVGELERAIRSPAERVGVMMEPGLVAAMVADSVEQPGALPLLQFALTELFEKRQNNRLSVAAYQAIGGVQGVLDQRAEETFDGLSEAGQTAARQVFLRLVTIGEGTSTDGFTSPDTRRRVLRTELEAISLNHPAPAVEPASPEDGREVTGAAGMAAVAAAIDAFGRQRLLAFDRDAATRSPTVEIAHEALLREWWRLRQWLDESRVDVRMQRALGSAAAEWLRSGRDRSFLLQGARLSLFEGWSEETSLALTKEERTFLDASLAESDAQQQAEAARKQREAALERRVRTFLRSLAVVLLLATVGSLFLAGLARRQTRLAASRELSVLAMNNLEVDPERSILLALQALRTAHTQEARDALHRAVQTSRVKLVLPATGNRQVRNIVYSPDGKNIAVSYFDDTVTVWEAGSGKQLINLSGGEVAYHPTNSLLAAGSPGGTITLREAATNTVVRTFQGHTGLINSLAFSPDGRLLASTSQDNSYKVWEVSTGKEIFSAAAPIRDYFPGNRAVFSPDGKLLFALDYSGVVKVWGVDREWAVLSEFSSGYNSFSMISPDVRWMISGIATSSGPVGFALWDIAGLPVAGLETLEKSGREPLLVNQAHRTQLLSLAFSADSSLLATGAQDSSVRVWRLAEQEVELLMTLYGHTAQVLDVAFSPDSSRLATGGDDGTVRIWDITPSAVAEWFALAAHDRPIFSFDFTRDWNYLATTSADGRAIVWDFASRKRLAQIDQPGVELFTVAIHPNGTLLVTGGSDRIARVWELDPASEKLQAKLRFSLSGHAQGPQPPPVGGMFPGLTRAIFSPDGTLLATGGAGSMANLWDAESGRELRAIKANPAGSGVTDIAFSQDGRYLVIGTDAPALAKVWEVATGKAVSTFNGHSQASRLWSAVFSPDGQQVATGGNNGELKIWASDSGTELHNLIGHTGTVTGAYFSADGRFLASSGTDGTARVWDAATGEMLQLYTSPSGAFYEVRFSPDGKRLIISGDGTIYGYIFDVDALIRVAHERLTRWFTPQECQLFLHQVVCPPQ